MHISASASEPRDLQEKVEQLQRKLVDMREQYETEMKVLEYTLTETHALQLKTLRPEIETEQEENYKHKVAEIEADFKQKIKAFKTNSEMKFVEELQKVH